MKRIKYFIMILFVEFVLFLLPNISHAAVDVTKEVYANNGSARFDFSSNNIQINFWNAANSSAYYQYEKITDENVINKYKEIKSKNGNYNDLQSLLKTKAPSSNWNNWSYWNGHVTYDGGFGYTQSSINMSDSGLYYMWIYLAGNNVRNLYGYILVDNLQPEIALDSISLPKTKELKLGKTLTLTPTFNPVTTTNKIVTWSSSDESVAVVDNAGKVTPKKIGSTIITVASQDGSKKATCTLTVVAVSSSNTGTNNDENINNSGSSNNGSSNSNVTNGIKDDTVAPGKLPKAGLSTGLILIIVSLICGSLFVYVKYRKLRGI